MPEYVLLEDVLRLRCSFVWYKYVNPSRIYFALKCIDMDAKLVPAFYGR